MVIAEHTFDYAGVMAAGGYGRGAGIPLKDRVRVGDAKELAEVAEPSLPSPETGDCPARHCWVSLPVDGSQPRAALLLEWRRVERGRLEGLVVYVAQLRPGRWASVTEWVPAELLTPA